MADESERSCSKVLVETPVSNLNPDVLEELGMYLNPKLPLKDIRSLAGRLGYSFKRVRNFEREQNPTLSVLEDWWTNYGKNGKEKTVSELVAKLKEMKRDDAVDFLKPYEFTECQQTSLPKENDSPIFCAPESFEAPRIMGPPVVSDKVALVIGNMKYDNEKLRHLMYPERDARDMADALSDLGFKVISLVNLTLSEMRIAVLSFCRLLGKGVYAVLYYAGHGFEDNGKNFLIPVDADITYKRDDSLCAQEILQTMQECNTTLNLLIIDSCRVRPPNKEHLLPTFVKRGTQGNNIFAYSCCSQQKAYEEHDQRNGLYAQHLLQHIKRNVRIETILMDVATDVAYTINYCNNNAIHQRPCHESDAHIDCRLTDPVTQGVLPDEYYERLELWQQAHKLPKSFVALENEDLVLEVQFKEIFSNVMDVLMIVSNKTSCPMNKFVMDLSVASPICSKVTILTGDEVLPQDQLKQIVQISALQKLNDHSITADLKVFYEFNGHLVSLREPDLNLGSPLVSSVFTKRDWWVPCGRSPPTKTTSKTS